MKNIFTVGYCTFSLSRVNDDGSKVYTVSRHGGTIDYGATFPADADISDFQKWADDYEEMVKKLNIR